MSSYVKYSEYYDLIYQDKDYEAECDFIELVFKKYSREPVKSVLDVGCGTGGHAIPLMKRGYSVTGIDVSATMLEKAKHRAAASGVTLDVYRKDIRSFNLKREFGACIEMFAVMDYLTETSDLQKALKNIRQHLREGSLFLFDFWNGLAVLRILPEVRVRTFEEKGIKLTRIVRPELDAINHICRINYDLLVKGTGKALEEVKETHTIRFYFPQEIRHHLEECGFKLLKFCPFPDLEGKADENTWSVAAIAKATGGGR
ncbi:MAG: hypothetical protein A2144_03875 [Chloroflexi bacterium RBG_16_50_9]|nr:MAG: hypothetical protein A2144_03875 [Chloroflexi bacterium RBG_16_50_9]